MNQTVPTIQINASVSSRSNETRTNFSPAVCIQNLNKPKSVTKCNLTSQYTANRDLATVAATEPYSTLTDLQKGFRILNPESINSNVLKSKYLKELPKELVKDTIISLPNKLYLIPVSYFKKDNVVEIPGNSKVASFIENDKDNSRIVKNDNVQNNNLKKNCCVQTDNFINDALHKADSKSTQVTQKKKPLFPRCWSVRKHRKIDLEGFSMYDRLGFFKSEHTRAKKCFNTLSNIIMIKEREVCKLKAERRKRKLALKNKKTERKFLAYAALKKRYHLKEFSIVLDRNEVSNYFKHKRLPTKLQRNKRRAYTEFEIPLSFETIPFRSLNKINFRNPVLFINHHNFGTIDYVKPEIETILFINTNDIVTEMCLDVCPQLKTAVKNNVVRIVNEEALENFLGTYTNQNITGHLPKKRRKLLCWMKSSSGSKHFFI